jgi:baseplate J-like protein
MPLLTPILDDRSYQQLRDELVRRIPVYTEEWTDHNPSDPGITLIELFAFLGENLLYRFNQIPDATRLQFLKLLQIPMLPASASRCQIELSSAPEGGTIVPRLTPALAGAVNFETQDEVDALPFEVEVRIKAAGSKPSDPHLLDFAQLALDSRGVADADAAWYSSVGLAKDPAAPSAQPLDLGTAVDGLIWVAVLRPSSAPPAVPGSPAIALPLRGKSLSLGITFDDELKSTDPIAACPGPAAVAPQPPPVIWQVSLGGHVDAQTPPQYRALALNGDTTFGLTRSGIVRLQLPAEEVGLFQFDDPNLAGTGDLPPVIDDPATASRLLFWLRAGRRPNSGSAPLGRLRWLGANAVEVVQSRLATAEFLGTGTAQPGQSYSLTHWPVIDGSLVLQVEEINGWQTWQQVDGFAASVEDDRHYVLELESGTVRFGSGIQGRAPQIGERIRALEYHYGGGPEGNVPAKAITRLEPPPGHPDVALLKANNPLPAGGGAPAESIDAALDRIPGELRRRDRAVTMYDFSELALQAPGSMVGRAEPLPLFHPDLPEDQIAPGVVSLVVWPREDRKHPDAPLPDRVLLRDVCSWLDSRRLVTTELHVIPPVYRKIAVSVGIKVKDGFGVDGVRQWVELVLRQYLAPLPPFGPDGKGWPLQRRVYGPELEAAVLQVEGVDYVEKLRLAAWVDASSSWQEMTAPILMGKREVPQLAAIAVVADPNPPNPGELVQPAAGDPNKPSIPIPVEKVGCA